MTGILHSGGERGFQSRILDSDTTARSWRPSSRSRLDGRLRKFKYCSEASDSKRLKTLETEICQLKRMYADMLLKHYPMKAFLGKL